MLLMTKTSAFATLQQPHSSRLAAQCYNTNSPDKSLDKIQLAMLTKIVESDEELNMNRPDGETIMQLIMPTCPVH